MAATLIKKNEWTNKSKIVLEDDGKNSCEVHWIDGVDVEEMREELKKLAEEESALDAQLKPYQDEMAKIKTESKKTIDKLHTYNEIKESCQSMIGKLAVLEGITIKQMYKQFNLELDD
ncbi:hypothetical protein SAMD00019534_045050 [Acytostelium subglobosum LB1]|uniref:hypothetical protein n=1 Tax=Acytostelium subglobosum LB1 TaxID=1410327 RepID=UPI0006448896|nr:hypothetical protein SAMD00019534_045050 [Acytostelium subglobosum LB1]GAM21330.1 hypothetical protein SAMD00019534_045050 [Acytostelium subglobosum LB1]|eukprot:XP_012755449.1 hypothetical protein SAMD00019534_045050 [Acytostelium subglobosum LB1]